MQTHTPSDFGDHQGIYYIVGARDAGKTHLVKRILSTFESLDRARVMAVSLGGSQFQAEDDYDAIATTEFPALHSLRGVGDWLRVTNGQQVACAENAFDVVIIDNYSGPSSSVHKDDVAQFSEQLDALAHTPRFVFILSRVYDLSDRSREALSGVYCLRGAARLDGLCRSLCNCGNEPIKNKDFHQLLADRTQNHQAVAVRLWADPSICYASVASS